MLDDNLKTQLDAYLRAHHAADRAGRFARRAPGLARDARAARRDRRPERHGSALRLDGDDARRPSFAVRRTGTDMGVRFAAIPIGHEFTSLVLALLQAGGHPPKLDADMIEQICAVSTATSSSRPTCH